MRELVLTGSPFDLALPDVCALCGAPAKGCLSWQRVFETHGDSRNVVASARAPFCPQCLAQHEREVKRMSAFESLLQCFRSEMMIPAVMTSGVGLWLVPKFFPKPAHLDWISVAVFCGLLGFFGLIAWGSFQGAWDATRHLTVPPLTTVTKAFGFSLDASDTFEGERHLYTLENDAFYEALLEANRDRMWKPSGERARAATEKRWMLYIVLGAVAVALLLWDWIGPWISSR